MSKKIKEKIDDKTLITMFQNIKKKELSPKIYSIVLQQHGQVFLYQSVDYTLEDAIVAAAQKAIKDNPLLPTNWLYVVGIHMSMEQLKDNIVEFNMKIVKEKEDIKNNLMKKIIKTKDKMLFEQNKMKFTEPEIKLLIEALKK